MSLRIVTKAANEVKAKMRWPAAEAQARAFSIAVMNLWVELEEKLIAWLPGNISVDAAREKSAAFYMAPHPSGCGCPAHGGKLFDIVEKMSAGELSQFRSTLAGIFSSAELHDFDKLWDNVLNKMMTGNGLVKTTDGVFNKWFKDVFQEGLNQAYRDGKSAIRTAKLADRKWFEKFVGEVYPFNEASTYVMGIYKEGFDLIKAKITRQFKGVAMRTIAEGIQAGISWDEVARSLSREVGTGALWHWKRLVRTEMVKTYDRSSKERYKNMRVRYVKLSLAPGACQICRDVYSATNGWWKMGDEPALPFHPSDRCRYLPKWNLPAGVRL